MPELQNDKETLGGVAGAHKVEGNREFVYVYVASGTAKGQPMILAYDGDEETNPKTAAPATNTAFEAFVVFPTAAGADAFQWCQLRGDAEVLVDGTTDVAKDDYLEVINAGTALIKDATSRGVGSVAIAQEALTTNAATLTNVYLLGEAVQVAAA